VSREPVAIAGLYSRRHAPFTAGIRNDRIAGFRGRGRGRAESRFDTPRDSQLGVYAGYLRRRGDWSAHLTLSRYAYPGIDRSYDYAELAAGFAYRDRYFFSLSESDSFLSIYDRASEIRTGVSLPWIRDLEFGMNLGRFQSSGAPDTEYTFWDVGLSRPLGRFAIDLRFHANNYRRSSLLRNYDRHFWLLSLSYAILPRERRS
jgi:hypothetical protein